MPRLFSYVVARDYGFAPNPFCGYCTLATCKPEIRKAAKGGDWVVGTGSAKQNRRERIVYAMCVSEIMSFNDYWNDPRFYDKRPDLHSSLKKAYGDNIYHRDVASGEWIQADSHHSYEQGVTNQNNLRHDTRVDRVLIAERFIYWGGDGPCLPQFAGVDIRKRGQGHRCDFSDEVVQAFVAWIASLGETGYCGDPIDW